MKRNSIIFILLLPAIFACRRNQASADERIITVSIAPFGYFVQEIGGGDFEVNVMVPPGSNPHIYEPYPEQIMKLRKSVAYISNGFLGFEMTWLDRFYGMNEKMTRLSFGNLIDPVANAHEHEHEGEHAEAADPHYWVSPACAAVMAASVRDLLCSLNKEGCEKYRANCDVLLGRINDLDRKADSLFSGYRGASFMIYHPNLAYLARDYGLEEVAVEFEGKEPPPSHLKHLVDLARERKITTIFVQKEYDSRNAKAIAVEIGAEVLVIDPLSPEWLNSVTFIIESLHRSLQGSQK
ncbi:MAG: zinc ABC transporter substrate-binding protein [Bacteroidales bacterium]|nr:zinc ABC transporter substrate-binding protein [Bacteroidales bacterium]